MLYHIASQGVGDHRGVNQRDRAHGQCSGDGQGLQEMLLGQGEGMRFVRQHRQCAQHLIVFNERHGE